MPKELSMKAYLFPGQGSQDQGMGAELFDTFDELIKKADKILGYSIKELCLEGPNKKLNQTQFTQPALYVVNALSYYKKIEETGQKPDYVAGHSLGEFNALLAAECFDFETGLKLVEKRGDLMSQATGGGMAAILNATKEEIETILKNNGLNSIDLANFNSPSQIVISGLKDDIEKAQHFLQDGDMLFIPLKISSAFHSRYMQPVKEEFETYLKSFTFSNLTIPVISNVSAKPYQKDNVVKNLSSQITSPVMWTESIQYLIRLGDMEFEEIGHGSVLTRLVEKIQKETHTYSNEEHDTTQKKKVEAEKPLTSEEKVNAWNKNHPIGTRVKSVIIDDDLETRTEAVVLFGHRAAVYIKGYNGYFDLDEITPL